MTWEKVRLGDVCEILDNLRKPLNNIERDLKRGHGTYPYFGANGIVDRIDEYIFDEPICCVAEDGGYWGANQKCSYLVNEKCWVNNHAHILRANEKISLSFLSLYLNVADLNSYITGSTRGKLTKGALQRIEIPLPPLCEQKRLAAILDRADELRRVRRKVLLALDELAQSLFLELFGDPATNPKGWPQKSIGEIGKVITGNTPPRANPNYYGNHIEWIKSDNLNTPHYYVTKATEGLSKSGKAVARTVTAGSILVTCIAGSPECIGNAAMTDREVAFNQQINALVPVKDDVRFLFNQILVGKRLVQEASTNGMKGLVSKGRFEQIRLIIPPMKLQQQFATQIAELETIKTRARASLTELDALFASLQSRAFAGELSNAA